MSIRIQISGLNQEDETNSMNDDEKKDIKEDENEFSLDNMNRDEVEMSIREFIRRKKMQNRILAEIIEKINNPDKNPLRGKPE